MVQGLACRRPRRPPPLLRRSPRHTGLCQPRQLPRCLGTGGLIRFFGHQRPPQLSYHLVARQEANAIVCSLASAALRRLRRGDHGDRLDAEVLAVLLDKPRGHNQLVAVLIVHRGDQHRVAGAGHRHPEQATFLGKALRGVRDRHVRIHPVIHQVHQILLAEQGAGLAEARPRILLHASHDDTGELLTRHTVRCEQRYRIRRRRPTVAHAGGQLLGGNLRDEALHAGGCAALGEVSGGVEKRHHGVQVAIRLRAARPAAERNREQVVGQAGGVPDRPQDVLHAAALALGAPARVQYRADALEQAALAVSKHAAKVGQLLRAHQQRVQRLLGARVRCPPPQPAQQAAQRDRVGAADRAEQEVAPLRGHQLLVQRAHAKQQRRHDALLA